jgi:gliding motility-associated-like protein
MLLRNFLFSLLLLLSVRSYGQSQDVEFHLSAHLLTGQKIIKVKRDFNDNYLWVLGQNNSVYRVNSATLAVDDYSSKFTPYNNLRFVDIMGRSADTVFIATNSANVIEWANGILHVIGSSDGIPGTVNSLGIDLGWGLNNGATRQKILIATDHGIRTLDAKTRAIGYLPDTGAYATNSKIAAGRIFESTYRTETYKDSLAGDASGWATDTLHYMPVVFNSSTFTGGNGGMDGSYIWEGNPVFGYGVNTVLALVAAEGIANDGFFTTYFWGSEKGMFQAPSAYSYNIAVSSWSQYLKDIKVNKISDIMGLTSFSNSYGSGLIKQNLLIGTDNGFYFSSSVYNPGGYFPNKFSLFHDDELGSIVINDICVNAVPNAQPICENGVWLAANTGLYLVKPDYAKYFNNQQHKLISFNNQPDTLSQMQVCSLSAVKATIAGQFNNIQWYKNGAELPGETKADLTITAEGDYNTVIYDPCADIHIESNHLKVKVIAEPVFTFNYADKLQYCDSASTTLKVNYSSAYHYRWYKNGALTGDANASITVRQSGKYKVEVSACTNSWVPSKEVEVDLVNLPVPKLSADKPGYCAADIATLSVDTPIDPSYTINWYLDGNLLPADNNLPSIKTSASGSYTVTVKSNLAACMQTSAPLPVTFAPAPTFTFNYPAQLQYCTGTPLTLQVTGSAGYQYRWYRDDALTGDISTSQAVTQSGKYKVEVSACAGSWVASSDVEVRFVRLTVPAITADKPAYCTGDNAMLTVNLQADPSYTINWYKDGALLPAGTNKNSFTTNTGGGYTVSVVNNTANTDGSTCSQTSVAQALTFNPPPTASIKQTATATLCDGQTTYLSAIYTGGTVQWSTGETTDQIAVTKAGTYNVTVSSAAGCTAEASIAVSFLPLPIFSIADTAICTDKKQVIMLMAPAGFEHYSWNGIPGDQAYQVTQPQTVSLTVTDVNGCQATHQIKVSDQCPDVFIPNTFTPNGDGINDTWAITGLDAGSTIKVFTRNGTIVYQSAGYGIAWNGAYNGKKLPAGVYYYVITTKRNPQQYSGAVTIIY